MYTYGCLVGEDQAAGLAHGVDDGLLVPGQQGAQVDQLAGNAQCLRLHHSLFIMCWFEVPKEIHKIVKDGRGYGKASLHTREQ